MTELLLYDLYASQSVAFPLGPPLLSQSRGGADDLRVNDDVLRWAAEVTRSR